MICRRCEKEKGNRFPPKRRVCRDCAAEISHKWRSENRERHAETCRKYADENKESLRIARRAWAAKNADSVRAYQKEYKKKNAERLRKQRAERYAADPERFKTMTKKQDRTSESYRATSRKRAAKRRATDTEYRIRCNITTRLNTALRKGYKSGSAVRDLGCSIPELRAHLEAQFTEGMSWETYGLHGWHIDHIRPLASFDLTDREQLLTACHFTNLQPLWAKDNLSKGATV